MKKAILPLILALVVLPAPSRDEDLWSAALTKARDDRRPPRGELLQAARGGGPGRGLDQGHPGHARPPLLFPRPLELLPDARGLYRASTSAWACRSRSRATTSSSSPRSRAARPTAWASCPATSSRSIDGESTVPISSYDAMQKLRGEKGTKVTVTFVREGADKPFDLTITREEIPLLSVPYAFLLDERHRLHLHPELRRGDAPGARGRAGEARRPRG